MPVSGAWRLSYSVYSRLDRAGEGNTAYLYINGSTLHQTYHDTWSGSGETQSTGGRVVIVEASAGDKIDLRVGMEGPFTGYYGFINLCAEFIPRM